MKKILLLLAFSVYTISCSDNNIEEDGYLTSLENVKNGVVGTWKSTIGIWYTNYTLDGTKWSGFEPSGNWESRTTYEIRKVSSDYIIRIYDVGGTQEQYTDWKIVVLNEKKMVTKENGGANEELTHIRITF